MSGRGANKPTFPIPSSLQELESAPYNLLPYPHDFDDDDEAARAESFSKLIRLLEAGNRTLLSAGLGLFEVEEEEEEDFDTWNDNGRIQALYTLVRKSDSLAPATRGRLVKLLCDAVHGLCEALESGSGNAGMVMQSQTQQGESQQNSEEGGPANSGSYVVSQAFRDAMACHIYMLFTVMFLTESKEKLGKSLGNIGTSASSGRSKKGGKSKKNQNGDKGEDLAASRAMCAEAMYAASITMSTQKSKLWKRSVPDEAVVGLPCRIAYQILEAATGVVARKASSGDKALQMIAATVDSAPCLLNTVVSALVDLLHTYDHMAPLVAELCTIVNESPTNILATELLREIGRLDTSGYTDSNAAGNKASGIKNVAPFISELAAVRPRVVLSNISLLLPHLDSEPYVLRSAIVNSIGHILVREDQLLVEVKPDKDGDSGDESGEGSKLERQIANMAKTRRSLFDILCDRTHDITSFTRAASLKVLNDLTEKQSLPLDRIMPVTAIAIDRLQDKTVMVRRYAMQLLTTLLENNPFMGMLNPDLYRTKIRELEAYLKCNVPEEILKARDAAIEEAKNNNINEESGEEGDGNTKKELAEIESAALAAAIADAESKQESNEDLSEAESEFLAKVRGLKFASSAMSFIEVFENANDSFQTMLMSSNPSDVTEALRFFVKAKHFGLPCAVTGMKRALALMWSNETNIQEEVLRAFVEVFVAEPGTEGKELLPENQIAQNFLDLAGEATVSELASIEEALGRLVKKEIIPPYVFSILWTMASQAEGELRASAMLVISMAASADPKIVDSAYRLQNLYDAGLGDYTEEHRDWKTARSAACALQRVARAKVDPSSAKYIILDLITERLVAVARGDWCDDDNEEDTNSWFCAAEQAINAIFTISPAPEKVAMEILLGHQAGIFGSQEEPSNAAHSVRLSRFFFVLGHIALKLLIYTEVLSSSVRRANSAKSVKKQESASSGKKDKDADTESKEGNSDDEEEDAIEAELGIAAQAEAETERKVAEISENEIVGRGMISLFTPMLLRVVANEEGTYSSPVLMQSATLALCKCMCIAKSFCEKHLTLLFSVLVNAPNDDQVLRANIVIAVGDLAFRFPNEVEPYTPKIYACLRDKSTRVRRHTLMVLTHLILNDMVKVKGNVCEIALCLQDQEPRIRDMARLLFHELSKRTNSPIYNLLPDIVSQLSQLNLKQEVFREIMLFLLSFIKKDRQNEMLMEKLIQRFPKCTSIDQKADLAYCIAQLKVNDKCIKCLNDTFKLYKDALFDEDVLKNFMSVVSKAKKNTKLDTKDALEELENKLNENAAAGMENVKASKKAARAKKRAAKRVARKKEWEESDEEEMSEPEPEDFEDDEENQPENMNAPPVEEKAAKTRSGRSNRSRRGRGVLS
mmetsp:Transcript_1590/g.3412  ORF Transcript_1590/g.3412 Transcript_1590/m.3412 type:complete len:1390 (+) Transcript_1590:152-4321(+)|eukprot:CAMPEP_0172307526 /NCGR_PEP_ID=MMETSP1058-20130122/8349_1 /TAXON_ID=83371 /ORGANISM="Detonula confervacea, Strain CCMP 353" /LENGTH=1389 /DNA_ID=CAMNT_0013019711 /DNA_START=105 /DNA_END=4274 /DNA_ORIENTATION=+